MLAASAMASRIGIFIVALVLATASIALSACGGDDDAEGDLSAAELSGTLPTAGELQLDEAPPGPPADGESQSNDAADLFNEVDGLVIGAATDPSELGAAIEEAGFQRAVGRDFGSRDLNVRIRAVQFDSEDGALEARELLHEEDLKSPCPDACIVTPVEYELDDVPDSAAVHHVPNPAIVPPGESGVEAHHAEFAIGPLLYVVQVDGTPSPTFSADFDKLMRTVYESASSAE